MKATLLRNTCGLLGLFIVTLFFSSTAFAQKEDTKLTKVKDDFTSEVTISTEEIKVMGNSSWDASIYFVFKGDSIFLGILHSSKWTPVEIFEISIIYEDGGTLKKVTHSIGNQVHQLVGYTAMPTFFTLNSEEFVKFSESAVSKMRINFNFEVDPVQDVSLKERTFEKIKSAALVLTAELSKNRITQL